jgi:hypothetical protein
MRKMLHIICVFVILAGCDRMYDSPINDGRVNAGKDDLQPKFYLEQYDPISDQGQYWHLDMMKQLPINRYHYELYRTGAADRNDPNGTITAYDSYGLQYQLACQSLCGLNDKVISDGSTVFGTWMDAGNSIRSYQNVRRYLGMAGPISIAWAGNPLLLDNYWAWDGGVAAEATNGYKYVLTDVTGNPESSVVAITASHVHQAVIVDIKNKQTFDDAGYTMAYDARTKTTVNAWAEFKNECNNRGLVVMPVQTGELADFAIANDLFVINLNKRYGTSSSGQNAELFREVLAWLQPNSPVYGWEVGIDEDAFVIPVSQSGNMMIAIGEFNLPYFSYDYKKRQTSLLANVINPQDIDYDTDKNFVSFYLSDGAHAGWMMNGFVENYYTDPNVATVKMNFGITTNTSMIDPLSFEQIISTQSKTSTLMESFGGGYYYADDFGTTGNRQELLTSLAKKVAAHMRQHRIKVLEQIAHDPKSNAAREAYQAFADANDQLEGIIAIQYAPSYAEGGGEIMWVTNKQGYNIPIITVSYAIWNHGAQNRQRDGTPTFVASRLNESSTKFSSVIIHAWSNFTDTGNSPDEIAENASGDIRGASAAEMCARRLNDTHQVCNMQELIWRVRMHYEPEQTKKYLSEYF